MQDILANSVLWHLIITIQLNQTLVYITDNEVKAKL